MGQEEARTKSLSEHSTLIGELSNTEFEMASLEGQRRAGEVGCSTLDSEIAGPLSLSLSPSLSSGLARVSLGLSCG